MTDSTRRCAWDGCEATKIVGRGLCRRDYMRAIRAGRLEEFPSRWPGLDPGQPLCTVDGCPKPVFENRPSKGWCTTHYTRWYRHGDVHHLEKHPRGGVCKVPECSFPAQSRGLCAGHYTRSLRGMPIEEKPLRRRADPGERRYTAEGYVRVKVPGHPRGGRHGWVLEHVVVMERVLHRRLLPGEQVHHRNGVRDDNQPDNLELWVICQPAGQRPADLVSWAKQILKTYGAMVETANETPSSTRVRR